MQSKSFACDLRPSLTDCPCFMACLRYIHPNPSICPVLWPVYDTFIQILQFPPVLWSVYDTFIQIHFRYMSSKSFNLPLLYGLFTIHSSKSFNLPCFMACLQYIHPNPSISPCFMSVYDHSSKSFNFPLFYGLFTIHSSKSFKLPLFLGRFLPCVSRLISGDVRCKGAADRSWDWPGQGGIFGQPR